VDDKNQPDVPLVDPAAATDPAGDAASGELADALRQR